MENASKALIIAGAILLSILIIGLGMYIFNQAKGAISSTTLDSQRAQVYNQQFENYVGNNITGSNVKALFNIIITHNNTNKDSTVGVVWGATDYITTTVDKLRANKNAVISGKTYNVEATEYYPNGYIQTIAIEENK